MLLSSLIPRLLSDWNLINAQGEYPNPGLLKQALLSKQVGVIYLFVEGFVLP